MLINCLIWHTGREMDLMNELIDRKSQIEAEIEKLIRTERHAVIAEMKKNIKKYGIQPSDLWNDMSSRSHKLRNLPAKYRNPETGEEWSGRGRPPPWIRDEVVWDKFLIATVVQ